MSETIEAIAGGRPDEADAARQRLETELADLENPWVVLSELHIGNAPDEVVIDYVAMHPDRGIALIDLDSGDGGAAKPEAAQLAVRRFRELLAAERFHEFFPGHLPIAHVAVPRQSGFRLQPAVDAALATAGELTVEPHDWANALGDLLIGPGDGEAATEPVHQPSEAPPAPAERPAAGEEVAPTAAAREEIGDRDMREGVRSEANIAEAVRLAAERRASRSAPAASTQGVRTVRPPAEERHEEAHGLAACRPAFEPPTRPIFEPTPEIETRHPRRRGRLLAAAAVLALTVGGVLGAVGGGHYLLQGEEDAGASSGPVASNSISAAPSITIPTDPTAPPPAATAAAPSNDGAAPDAGSQAPSDIATSMPSTPPGDSAAADSKPAAPTASEPAQTAKTDSDTAPPPDVAAVAPAPSTTTHADEQSAAAPPPRPAEKPASPPAATAENTPKSEKDNAASPPATAATTTAAAPTPPVAAARQPERPSSPAKPQTEHLRPPTRLASRPPAEQRQTERSVSAAPSARQERPDAGRRSPAASAPAPSRDGPPIDASDLPPLDPGSGSSSPPPVATRGSGPTRLQRPAYDDPAESGLPPLPPTVAQANAPVPVPPPAPPVGGFGGSQGIGRAGNDMADCRPYTSATSITGQERSVEGMACRLPDGRWKLVTETPRR